MALPHAQSGEPISILAGNAASNERQSTALLKTEKLEVMHLVLAKGKSMPAHKVTGEITVHCLSGSLEMEVEGRVRRLITGSIVYLAGGVVHELRAIEDTCVLVHVLLQG